MAQESTGPAGQRRPAVSKEDFFAAADAMLAEGTPPTLAKLRDRVGGSFTTLSPWLAEWKAQQQHQAVAVLEVPETVLAGDDRGFGKYRTLRACMG